MTIPASAYEAEGRWQAFVNLMAMLGRTILDPPDQHWRAMYVLAMEANEP